MTKEQAREYSTRIRLGEPVYWVDAAGHNRGPSYLVLADRTAVAMYHHGVGKFGLPDHATIGVWDRYTTHSQPVVGGTLAAALAQLDRISS